MVNHLRLRKSCVFKNVTLRCIIGFWHCFSSIHIFSPMSYSFNSFITKQFTYCCYLHGMLLLTDFVISSCHINPLCSICYFKLLCPTVLFMWTSRHLLFSCNKSVGLSSSSLSWTMPNGVGSSSLSMNHAKWCRHPCLFTDLSQSLLLWISSVVGVLLHTPVYTIQHTFYWSATAPPTSDLSRFHDVL